MSDLNALFDSVDGLKEDLIEYGTIAAGAIGANVVWNIAVARFGSTLPAGPVRQYGIPAAAILLGIFGGRMVARYNRKIGLGATIGLVAAGLTQLTKQFIPSLPVAGLSASEDYYGVAGYLNGPMTVEEDGVNGFGGPVTIEQDSVNGFQAVLQ
jgi:hypothetical protein